MFRPVDNILGSVTENRAGWSKRPAQKKVYAPTKGSKLYNVWVTVPKHWVRANEISSPYPNATGMPEYSSTSNLLHELWLGGYLDTRHMQVGGKVYREYRRW